MLSVKDLYDVVAAMVPLYAALIIGYGSVKWWKILTPVQCSGINLFVSSFGMPFLLFHYVSMNNPYKMDMFFMLGDTICKILILLALGIWATSARNGSLGWLITLFSVATLPNTLVMGIPLLGTMYGSFFGGIMVQLVMLQSVVWYTLLVFLFEYRAAKLLVTDPLRDTVTSVDTIMEFPEVDSSPAREDPQTQGGVSHEIQVANVYCISHEDVNAGNIESIKSKTNSNIPDSGRSPKLEVDDHIFVSNHTTCLVSEGRLHTLGGHHAGDPDNCTPYSESTGETNDVQLTVQTTGTDGNAISLQQLALSLPNMNGCFNSVDGLMLPQISGSSEQKQRHSISKHSTASLPTKFLHFGEPVEVLATAIMVILKTACQKLLSKPTTYASLLGLAWSLIAFRWNIGLPKFISGSIQIIVDTSTGMAMFSLGLFMALQPAVISCDYTQATIAMAIKFIVAPGVMFVSSIAVGLRGDDLRAAIVQAALPQGIMPFVFAREYDLHPDILSTSIVFGMLISLPVTLLYYISLKL